MAYFDTTWYVNAGDQSTTGYYAVTKWAATTAVAAGVLRRQLAVPTVGNERVFVCIVAGTTGGSEPAWVLTRGAKTTDSTVTWMEVTGQASLNGDFTNTPSWNAYLAAAPGSPSLGVIISRNSGASYQICTTAGTFGSVEPTFSDTAGVVSTGGGTSVWTSLGPVGSFTGGQAPFARLASVFGTSWFVAGNTIYVGDNHAESQTTAITIAPTIAVVTFSRIICHNHSGSYPPTSANLATTATVSTTAGANISISPVSGPMYLYGLTFRSGVGSGASAQILSTGQSCWVVFENCSFQVMTTVGSFITFGTTSASTVILINTTVRFTLASQGIILYYVDFIWQNTGPVLASGSAIPTSFIQPNNNGQRTTAVLEALDLSQLSGNIFSPASLYFSGVITIKDCKLHTTATVVTPYSYGGTVQLVRSSS